MILCGIIALIALKIITKINLHERNNAILNNIEHNRKENSVDNMINAVELDPLIQHRNSR